MLLLAGVEGFEPSRTVLETGMLPLHHTPIFLMIWTHISFHPTLEELLLGVKKVVIPFIKVFPVSLVDIVSPLVPQILS